jgi:hypothetical protein
VGPEWVSVEILSEPFVRFANHRYLPAVEVEVLDTGEHTILYVAAKSLAEPLEEVRATRGSLEGATVRLRTYQEDQYRRYQLEELGRPANLTEDDTAAS